MENEVTHKSPLKEIAKQVRAQIKKAKAEGRLAKETKVSVRTQYYSMGCSLNVTITKTDTPIISPEYQAFVDAYPHTWPTEPGCPRSRYTAAAEKEVGVIDAIVEKYHRNDSDSMTDYYDVNFSYTGCDYDYDLMKASRDEVRESNEENPDPQWEDCSYSVVVKDVPNIRVVEYEPDEDEGDEVTWTKEGRADLNFAQIESDRDCALKELQYAQARYDKLNERYQNALDARNLRTAAEDAMAWAKQQQSKAEELERALCDLPN